MKVEGIKKYFSEGWNYMDAFGFIFSNIFIVVRIMDNNQDEQDKSMDLENILKLLKAFILVVCYVKLTWFQKLFKSFGLL